MPWNIIGHSRAVRSLETALANEAVQHAYLFVGPSGVGRATVARRLAQGLNCTGEAQPCLECGQCRRIEAGIHADVQTVTVEAGEGSSRKAISIEQLREAEQHMALMPYEGRTRVVIVDPADAVLGPAQNAFLKTLEEPPPNVVIVLVVANVDLLLETIRSRCARVDFGLVGLAEIEAGLVERGVEEEAARLWARLSGGRPGWALAASSDPSVLEGRHRSIETGRSLAGMSMSERMDIVQRLAEAFREDREPVLRTLDEWARWWRDVFLVQSGVPEGVLNIDMLEEAKADGGRYERGEVLRFIQALLHTGQFLRENVQTRIALDALMLAVPSSARRGTFTGS